MSAPPIKDDLRFLRHAARLAVRGHGGAEPNPQVGCVIVSRQGGVVGEGYHRKCGGPHAEIHALRSAGARARGAVLYCTLEPCNHTGRTGPCTQAIIDAGIARVVIARRDPNPIATGGLDRLRSAGIEVEINDRCDEAIMVSDAFAQRVRSGLPWVTVKWAQTIDGRIATTTGESQWISGPASRRLVHMERGRVDVILTGIGTVLKDDPALTARDVRIRRVARRVVVDPKLQIPLDSHLVKTARQVPVTVFCDAAVKADARSNAARIEQAGIELIGVAMNGADLPLGTALRELVTRHDATHVLTEAGPGLVSRLFKQRLVNQAWVFTGPTLLGDDHAPGMVRGMTAERLTDGVAVALCSLRRRGSDVIARYRVVR